MVRAVRVRLWQGRRYFYISGSFGLGHVHRDLAIVSELRREIPEVEVSWLAAHPASLVLKNAGETLLREADLYANDSVAAESAAKGVELNIVQYLLNARQQWAQNAETFRRATEREQFDLIIGDEAYEIGVAFLKKPSLKTAPFVMIYDFVGLDATTKNPLEMLAVYVWNRTWAQDSKVNSPDRDSVVLQYWPSASAGRLTL